MNRKFAGAIFFALAVFAGIQFECPSALAQSESPIDQLVEKARAGTITRAELADRVLAQAEVDQSSINNPERLILVFPGFVDELGPLLVSRVEAAVTTGNSQAAEQLKEFALRLLGEKSRYYSQVDRWCSLNFRLKDLISRGTPAELKSFRDSLKGDAEKKLFLPQLERFVGQTLVRRLRQDPPLVAIKNLAEFASLDQTDSVARATAELAAQLVQLIGEGKVSFSNWTLDEPAALALFARTVKAVPESEDSIIQIYAARVRILALGEKWTEIEDLLKRLGNLFPDRPEFRLALLEQAVSAVSSSTDAAQAFAKRGVAELADAGMLSSGDKIKFMIKGFYAATLLKVVCGVLLFVLLTLVGLIVAARFGVGGVVGKGSERIEQMQRERLRKKAKKRGVGYIAPIDGDDEYTKLLKKFGLDERATEADIKKAYRKMVKEYHPDAQGSTGVKTDSAGNVDRTFEELKKTYERLLAMRGALFGSGR